MLCNVYPLILYVCICFYISFFMISWSSQNFSNSTLPLSCAFLRTFENSVKLEEYGIFDDVMSACPKFTDKEPTHPRNWPVVEQGYCELLWELSDQNCFCFRVEYLNVNVIRNFRNADTFYLYGLYHVHS